MNTPLICADSPGISWHFSTEANARKGAASITPPRPCQIVGIGFGFLVLTAEQRLFHHKGRKNYRQVYAGESSFANYQFTP